MRGASVPTSGAWKNSYGGSCHQSGGSKISYMPSSPQKRSINLRQPFILLEFHGAAFSKSPMNISNIRMVSAP